MSTVIDCLEDRGLIGAMTAEHLRERVKTPLTFYLGFDPTANSLHIGHWLAMVIMAWFQKYGHTPIVILGGATGRIGDPSGKSVERPLLSEEEIQKNVASLQQQFGRVLDFSPGPCSAKILDNHAWFRDYSLLNFLRDIGRHFRVGAMLAKDSVRSRIESEEGISFTEFSYQMLQAYDFYYLHQTQQVELQLGGSDQWGNITAGLELIRKLSRGSAFGLTFPLLTRSDGKKFGKTEGGAVWLDAGQFSPYQFYQYFIRMPDADVIKMMRMLTFMDLSEVEEYEEMMTKSDYVPNSAQRRLAEELTRLVHGEKSLLRAQKATEGAAPGAESVLDVEMLEEIARDIPSIELHRPEVIGEKVIELMVKATLVLSKGEGQRLIQNGGAYLNNQKLEDAQVRIEPHHLLGDRYLLLAAGKKKKALIRIVS